MSKDARRKITLKNVLITEALDQRSPRHPDLQAEIDAFHALAGHMASHPATLPKALMQVALQLCRAGSAGVSLLESASDGQEYFRWFALAGAYEGYEGGTSSRHFSPCGTCLNYAAPQLFSYPARYFTPFEGLYPPIVEVLVLPFGSEMPVLGTIWIVSHDELIKFDREDVRVMSGLAEFTAAALRLLSTSETNARLCRTLQNADRRKDVFLATLAHELRNPLAPLRNAVQVLELKCAKEPSLDWARGVIERQVHQMTHLIDDLLDVSRIALDKLVLHKESLTLETALQAAVETSRPFINEHGHELIVSIPSDPIPLNADLTRLCQVFWNLLNNAAKYSERGSRIWLTAEHQGNEAVISVRDNGIGIPREMLPQICEMYTQVAPELARSEGGLGIGLALVKQLVELHGGTLEIRSDGVNQGSEFIVRLPVDPSAKPRRLAGETRSCSPCSLRILVVDDHRDAADSLSILLQLAGHEPQTAYDGEEALQLADDFRPEVVLLDIGLPKRNGFEVAEQIRQQPWGADTVLIALTGWGQEEDRQRSSESGFDNHIIKPVEIPALMELLAGIKSYHDEPRIR